MPLKCPEKIISNPESSSHPQDQSSMKVKKRGFQIYKFSPNLSSLNTFSTNYQRMCTPRQGGHECRRHKIQDSLQKRGEGIPRILLQINPRRQPNIRPSRKAKQEQCLQEQNECYKLPVVFDYRRVIDDILYY